MFPRLETARLELRPLELADAAASQVPWPYRDDAIRAMAAGREWHWSLRLKSAPDQLMGSIALMKSETNNRGFWIGVPWQGQGLIRVISVEETDDVA